LPKIDGYKPKDIFNVNETALFYNLQPSKTLTYKGDSSHGGTKSKKRATVLLGCNNNGTDKLSPLVTEHSATFQICKKYPHQIHSKFHSWMTSVTFEEFLMYLEHQRGAKNRKILPFMDQCAAHPRDTTALKNIKVIVAPQTVLHKFDFNNEYDQGSKKYKSSVFLCFP